MDKKIAVRCECEGTGFVPVFDPSVGDIGHFECGRHNPAYQDAPSVDALLAHLGKQTGLTPDMLGGN